MRRRATLSLILMLGLVFAIGMTPGLLAAQQDQTSKFDDITVQPLEGNGTAGTATRAYQVLFANAAYIPEREYPEAMVIKVLQGTLAFRVQTDDVLVDPQGDNLTVLEANPPIPLGADPRTSGHTFSSTGAPVTCSGAPPNVLCLINKSVVGENFVELRPGYTVYLPSNTICFFCNVTGLDLKDDKSQVSSPNDQVELLVWAPQTNFSWYNAAGAPVATPPIATPSASTDGLRGAVGWTVLRNPGSPCH